MSYVNKEHKLNLTCYEELYQWSISEISLFWKDVWKYCRVICSVDYDKVVDEKAPIYEIPKWVCLVPIQSLRLE